MDSFSKTFTHKGHSIKLDASKTPDGQMQMNISGPKSRLSYTGSPEVGHQLVRRLLGKSGNKQKNDKDADDR